MKNIIIFGGAGFIGTNLTKRLLDVGNKVICVDNLFTGRKSNIAQFLKNDNYYWINQDITSSDCYDVLKILVSIVFDSKVDEIYNLACPASPTKYQIDTIYTIHASLAIEDICKLAIEYGARMLHSSTSEVYGDPIVHPQTEDYRGNVNTIGPRACYDEGKRIAETIIYEYAKRGCKAKIIRIFNTYGPWMDPNDGRVISNFVCQALLNKDITIYGDGTQTRSFQYIDDLIDGMLSMMGTEDSYIGPVNLGSPYEFTMNELAQLVLEKIPESTSKIVYKELPEDDPVQRKANIDKMYIKTAWQPYRKLDVGLDKTISYFKKELQITNFQF